MSRVEKAKRDLSIFCPLTVGTIYGAFCGYAVADSLAGSEGYWWGSHYFIDQSLMLIICGTSLGIVLGTLIGAVPKWNRYAVHRLPYVWTAFAFCLVVYQIIRPILQVAR
jgi:NhaP-type Na+/H+ or K+/H+ antiporter